MARNMGDTLLAWYFPFVIYRVATLGLIFIFHSVIIIFLSLALDAGSGVFPTIPLAVDWLVLISVACYMIHRVRRPQANKIRNLVSFCVLSPVCLANSIILLVRVPDHGKGNLRGDFSGLANSQQVTTAVVVLSCLSTFMALCALCITPWEPTQEKVEHKSLWHPPRIIHQSTRVFTVPARAPWDPTRTQKSSTYAQSQKTIAAHTRIIKTYDGDETTTVTWTEIPL